MAVMAGTSCGLARAFVAPHGVSYHLEHHLLPAVPPHKLRRLHLLLAERGFYDDNVDVAPGYGNVVSRLTLRDAPST